MISQLIYELKHDADYRMSWKANIAMAFQDQYHHDTKKTKKRYKNRKDLHRIANEAADNFINNLCR